MIVAELEALFKGDLTQFEKDARTFEATGKRLTSKPLVAKVDADVRTGLANIDRLEDRVRRSDETVKVDADTSRARDEFGRFVKQSKDGIEGLADSAEGAGDDGGQRGGKALAAGIVGALATIPIAGALVGIANAAAEATVQGFQDGLAVEVRADRLAASTNLDEATVGRLGAAAGESYADNFGESIAANMDAAKRAVQGGLLDPEATQRDAQDIISSLSGVADLVEEDVARVSRSATQLLKTGLAKNAQEAFDIIVAGQQAGLNVSEDWLDTLDEYSIQWQKLGLEGGDVLGLLSQGVQAGARDTDIAADAFKELAIRAVDGSTLTAEGFEAIGRNAEEMSAKFAAGGESAREALGDTLDGLREIEDPIKRDAAAVALFGTQAEDLGKALYAMDLDTAAEQFEDLEGRAARALSTLGDNAAGDLETARRNIDVAVQGIQGALASAFSDDIEAGAEFVSENREAVTQFLLDAANAALDFGRAAVEGAAAGTEGFGDFVGETGPAVLDLIGSIIDGIDSIPFVDLGDAADDFAKIREEAEDSFAEFDSGSEKAADAIRTNLIENGLDPAQEKLNKFGEGALSDARLSDSTKRLANDIADVGYAADGSKISLDRFDGSLDTSTSSGSKLDKQIRGVKSALEDQVGAAYAAGESQKSLRGRVESARGAFIDQMTALGLTRGEAEKLANAYGLVPKKVVTEVTDNGSARRVKDDIDNIPSSKVVTILTVLGQEPAGTGTVLKRSGGGSVLGPGTGTSDSVAAMLSNGEHVWTAHEVRAAGGHAAMYRMRAAAQNGVLHMASGGAVGSAERELAQQLRFRKDAAARVHAARKADRDKDTAATARALESAEERLAEVDEEISEQRSRLESLRQERSDATRALRRGDIRDQVTGGLSGALSQVDSMYDLALSGDLTKEQSKRLKGVAGDAESALRGLYKAAERVEGKLEDARERRDELLAVRDSVQSNLVGGFGLAGVEGAVDPWSGQKTPATGQQLKAAAEAYKGKVQKYALLTKKLVAAGAGPAIMQELGRYGIEDGIPVAEALLSLPKDDLKSLAQTYDAIAFYGGRVGEHVTDAMAPGGLSAAELAVKSAEAQVTAIDKRIDSWATRIGNATAKALGIKQRASGGPAMAGHAYLVNEATPRSEIFVPEQSGYVLNSQQQSALGMGGPSVTHNWNITQYNPVAEPLSVTAAKTARQLANVGRR